MSAGNDERYLAGQATSARRHRRQTTIAALVVVTIVLAALGGLRLVAAGREAAARAAEAAAAQAAETAAALLAGKPEASGVPPPAVPPARSSRVGANGATAPPEVTPSAETRSTGEEQPQVTDPAIKIEVKERIDGLDWQEFLTLAPNPEYKTSIGQQLGGQLFFHDHGWVVPTTPEGEAQASFVAMITIQATRGREHTWMGHHVQTFYDAQITLDVTRVSDGVKVLSVIASGERANREEGQAARAAILEAAQAIVKDERIKHLALWQDPATAPAVGTPIAAGH